MENVEPLRPRQRPTPPGTGRSRRWRVWVLFLLVPLVLVALTLMRLWIDLLWFAELDQRDVLVTRLQWSTAMGLVSGVFAFALFHLNFALARRVAKNDLYVPFLASNANPEAPEQPVVPHFVMRPILLGVSLVAALMTGLAMANGWETVLRFVGRSDFGMDDPFFGRDVSFYVFTMPLLELIVTALQVLVVLTAIMVAVAYVAMGVVRYTPGPRIARPAALHLVSLLAAFFVVEAASFRLDMWNLVNSEHGAAVGVAFTDANARLPAYWFMLVATLLFAAVAVVMARRNRWNVVGYGFVVWLALAVLTTSVAPGLVQRLVVKPNELQREQKVLSHNIRLTRAGFGLDDVREQPFRDRADLTVKSLGENRQTTDNIRLWSPDVLQRSLTQLQQQRAYYDFLDVDVDRYKINGRTRQVMLAARELNTDRLERQGWVSQHLQFTHGYGVVGAWPNETANQGRPELFLRDIPPRAVGQDDIKVTRPEIYFGEEPDRPVVVNTDQEEIDYPGGEGDENVTTRYKGPGGIRMSSPFHRFALAATTADWNLFVSSAIRSNSRYMFRRNIRDRITRLAPFLRIDSDPYIVIHEGRLLWLADAYTTTARFPYSEAIQLAPVEAQDLGPGERINYVRNSVKAVMDAYTGEVTLYAFDERDPLLKAWRRIFPTLFTDIEKLPEGLEAHLRYPEDMFNVQTNKWLRYHVDALDTFYANEDEWDVPSVNGEELAPFYIVAKLPGEAEEEMLLVRPVTPRTRKNLIAYMAVRMDPGKYGEIITLTLPKQSLTQGPAQVSALIRQDTEIAAQLKLWEQRDTEPVFGNLLVLPIENSLLYAQPIYLESSEAQLPEFRRVVLVMGDTIAWGDSFESAARELFRKRDNLAGEDDVGGGGADNAPPGSGASGPEDAATDAPGAGEAPGDEAPATDDDAADGGTGAPGAADSDRILREVSERYDRALECQRQGDWECYGRETKAIERLLEEADVG